MVKTKNYKALDKESFYMTIVEESSDYIILFDRSLRFLYMNRAGLNANGVNEKQIIGKTIRESGLFNHELRIYWEEKIKRVVETGFPEKDQIEWRDHEGIKWLDRSFFPESDDSGTIISVLCIMRDITDIILAEQALKEDATRYKLLFSKAPLGYQLLDNDGKIIEVNEIWLDTFGYNNNEVAGKWFGDYLAPEDRDAFHKLFSSADNEDYMHCEFKMLHKNGESLFISFDCKTVSVLNNSLKQTHCILKDISEQRKYVDTLRENEKMFSHFLEHSPVYVFFKDEEIRTLRLSKNYEEMLGIPLSGLLGKTMYDLFPSDLASNMIADDKRILQSGKFEVIEEHMNNRYYATYKFPIKRDDEPGYLAGYTIDITDQKLVEKALKDKAAELERFNNLMIGRELKMIELKKEINDLLIKAGEQEKYKINEL